MVRLISSIIIVIILILSVTNAEFLHNNVTESSNDTDSVPTDVYVLKTVIYEIGVLTNATDDNNTVGNDTHEKVEISFYTPSNISLNSSNIPVPIQNNLSGLSAILPVNLKTLLSTNGENSSNPALSKEQGFRQKNINKWNLDKIVSKLPQILGLESNKNQNISSITK